MKRPSFLHNFASNPNPPQSTHYRFAMVCTSHWAWNMVSSGSKAEMGITIMSLSDSIGDTTNNEHQKKVSVCESRESFEQTIHKHP